MVERDYQPLIDLSSKAVHSGLSPETWLVLHDFALCTDVDGVAELSIGEVASQLHQSSDMVAQNVAQLIVDGFLEDLGGCPDDEGIRRWRVAGMDRRDRGES
jgi:hypothetical protein